MMRFSQLSALCVLAILAQPAFADTTTYEFTAVNKSVGPITVSADGKVGCAIEAGKSCRMKFANGDAALSYSLAGATNVSFTTGNIEAADVCNIDASGAHCADMNGHPTN